MQNIHVCAALLTHTRLGRKFWLVEASIQMMIAEVVMTAVMATQMGPDGQLPQSVIVGLLVVVCVFIAGHAWGWGPMVRRRRRARARG